MPIVSGTLYYDGNRTASAATATGVIPNVPIVLLDSSGVVLQTVLTNSGGHFEFQGVVAGSYMVSEAFDGVIGKCPPNSYVQLYSPGVVPGSALDCTVRNTWLETVGAADITNINMLNGPVNIIPLVLDSNIVVDPANLVTAADNGTFGSFNPGTVANTGAGTYPNHPYPQIQSMFSYVEPEITPTKVTPPDGSYTVQNIMNSSWSNSHPSTSAPSWWRVADHTTGNETGRMMVINGYTSGYIIGKTTVNINPNTDYLTSYWILNLCRQASGYVPPEFSVSIFGEDGSTVIYQHDFTDQILPNTECPEWVQIGTIFNTGDNSEITIEFISQGGPQTGNDYVLDDVALNKVETLKLDVTKEACGYATVGGVLKYLITITNPTEYIATGIVLNDDVSMWLENTEFTVDGETWLPWTGMLKVDDMLSGESGDIIIQGKIKQGTTDTIINKASVQVTFCPQEEI